jgi:hypothetical protein
MTSSPQDLQPALPAVHTKRREHIRQSLPLRVRQGRAGHLLADAADGRATTTATGTTPTPSAVAISGCSKERPKQSRRHAKSAGVCCRGLQLLLPQLFEAS